MRVRRSQLLTGPLLDRRYISLAMLLIVAMLITACGGDSDNDKREDDRQFANDPTNPPTATSQVTETPSEATTAPTDAASPEAMLEARGGPVLTWALIGPRIVQIDPARPGVPALEIFPEQGTRFIALDSAPSGIRVAALVLYPDGSLFLELYDSGGVKQAAWDTGLGGSSNGATPIAIDSEDFYIDWGGDGSRIIVGNSSALKSFGLDGTATDVSIAPASGTIRHASWSPTSDTVALLLERDGGMVVSLFRPGDPASRPSQVVPTGNSIENVTSFVWIPDGSGLIYLQAGTDSNQLYRFDVKREKAVVVATPGQGGPSGRISQFTISPDGEFVAYVVKNLDGDQLQYHSLWIRSLRTGQTYQVPTGYPQDLNAMWWTKSGFVWGQLTAQEDGSLTESFIQLVPGDQPRSLLDVSVRPGSGATPVASPVATPAAEASR